MGQGAELVQGSRAGLNGCVRGGGRAGLPPCRSNSRPKQIELTPEQDDVICHAIAAGRIARPEDAVAQAMAFWIERDRELADLSASLDAAEASNARGESVLIENDEDLEKVFGEIKRSYRTESKASAHGEGSSAIG